MSKIKRRMTAIVPIFLCLTRTGTYYLNGLEDEKEVYKKLVDMLP